MKAWTLTIEDVPPSGNVIKRMHWMVYTRLLEHWYLLIRAAHGFLDVAPPAGRRIVTITRYGKRPLDRDNLYAAMKPVVDVCRPARHDEGVYKTGKRAGQAWSRNRIGHGLILEDDEEHLDLRVHNGKLEKGRNPYLEIVIEDA